MHNNNNYHSDLDSFSSNPRIRQIAAEHLRLYGSVSGITNATYNSSNNNTNTKTTSYSSNSSTAGSNGKYMVHCYFGCQPGNKITTVIG